MRIAAVSDLHYNKSARGKHESLFRAASDEADVLLLCGDLTDHGQPEEVAVLVEDLHSNVRIPMIGILGNHDYESGCAEDVVRAMEEIGVHMLDGDCVEIDGIGFAGTCGFAGGFGKWALHPWGEPAIKHFVQATIEEALKLEQGLARLQTAVRVALLHYAPIRDTVAGEPGEIFPFLGSSRLEDPLNHFEVAAAFHGHAHHGSLEGRTSSGVPVYNVSIPLLHASDGRRPPFKIVTLQAGEETDA